MIWIPITLGAAFVQNGRFMLQKRLTEIGLSTAGATFARYVFSLPLVFVLLWAVLRVTQERLPAFSPYFFFMVTIAAIGQIAGTLFTIALFRRRNFAVGTVFKRTEVIMSGFAGVLILNDHISLMGWCVLVLGLFGAILLSKNPTAKGESFFNIGLLFGLGSGVSFGLCGVFYRAASLSLPSETVIVSAITTLTASIIIQTAILLVYFCFRERGELSKLIEHKKLGMAVGVTSLLGSSLIFTAMTLHTVAYVNAVQQVELLFAALGSYYYFNERLNPRELIGCVIIVCSVLSLILFV